MANYFVTQSGAGSANGSSVSNAYSLSGYNSASFSAGDVVNFIGTFTGTITIDNAGTNGNPIVYKGVNSSGVDDGTNAVVDVSTSSDGILIQSKFVLVENFEVDNAGSGSCIGVDGGIDNASEPEDCVHIRDCIALANGGNGDGFSVKSNGSSTATALFTRCEARAITGAGDQGFTNHDEQGMVLVNCSSTAACQLPFAFTGLTATVRGGSFISGVAGGDVGNVDATCVGTFSNAKLVAQGSASNSNLFATVAGELNKAIFNDCILIQETPATGTNFISGSVGAGIFINGGTLEIKDFGAAGAFNILNNGVALHLTNVHVTLHSTNTNRSFVEHNGTSTYGDIVIQGCIFDCSDVSHSGYRILDHKTTNSSSGKSEFVGNVVRDATASTFSAVLINSNTQGTINISNNTFHNMTQCIDNNSPNNSNSVTTIDNNIFVECTTTLTSTTNIDNTRRNAFHNNGGSEDTFGSNAITSDPLFVDEANNDFRLTANSPSGYKTSGENVSSAFVDADGRQFRAISNSLGAFLFAPRWISIGVNDTSANYTLVENSNNWYPLFDGGAFGMNFEGSTANETGGADWWTTYQGGTANTKWTTSGENSIPPNAPVNNIGSVGTNVAYGGVEPVFNNDISNLDAITNSVLIGLIRVVPTVLTPRTMPATPNFISSDWRIVRSTGIAESPFTGATQAHIYDYALWKATVSLPPMRRETSVNWQKFLMQVRGRGGTFLMGDPDAKTPRGSISGTAIVYSGIVEGQNQIQIKLSAGAVNNALRVGDYIQIGASTSASLHMVMENVSSNSAGIMTVDIEPKTKKTYSANAPIFYQNTVGLFRMDSNDLSWSADHISNYGISFSCTEVFDGS